MQYISIQELEYEIIKNKPDASNNMSQDNDSPYITKTSVGYYVKLLNNRKIYLQNIVLQIVKTEIGLYFTLLMLLSLINEAIPKTIAILRNKSHKYNNLEKLANLLNGDCVYIKLNKCICNDRTQVIVYSGTMARIINLHDESNSYLYSKIFPDDIFKLLMIYLQIKK